ncbi:helix-turn-helix domain-containing protein [Salinimicrobium sp. CDJ15-81-2]|nr:helix-turn-helix domain-containing protein [Salinimicrobium nanhaiense]
MTLEQTRDSIAFRIKQLRKEKKFSQTYVARDLSITQAAYSRIENAANGIVAEHLIKLSDIFEVTTDYILKGNKNLIEVSFKTGFLPLITCKAHAGFVENFKGGINFDDKDWFKIPGFNPTKDQRLFEVEGNSMLPTIFPGDVLISQVQQDISKLLSGSLILLITHSEILAKRFEKLQKDTIYVSNDNIDFPQQQLEFHISEIQEVLIIRGKISSALIPGHQVISNNKIIELEENMELLKKEMFSLHKTVNRLKSRN